MFRKLLRALAFVVMIFPTVGFAASFDCNRAQRPDEIAICRDAELSRQDEILSRAYQQAKNIAGKNAVNKATRLLLKARRACGTNVSCIRENQRAALDLYRKFGADSEIAVQPAPDVGYVDLDLALPDEEYRINQETFLFKICNNYNRNVFVATTSRMQADSARFHTVGWFQVAAGTCTELGPYYKGDFMWTANADNGVTWGKGSRLCVEGAAFNYEYFPSQPCGRGYTMNFTHIFAVRDREMVTLAGS